MINAVLQDHQGFMWIGTKDGLNQIETNNLTQGMYILHLKNNLENYTKKNLSLNKNPKRLHYPTITDFNFNNKVEKKGAIFIAPFEFYRNDD